MDWCRLSTGYYLDGALLRAGEPAEVLFLRCIAYSGAQETRGRVPKHVLPMLTPTRTQPRLKALLDEGLLLDEGNDVTIRSWDRWQEALDSESERRRKDRERKRAARQAAMSADDSSDASADIPRTVRAESARKEVEEEEEKKELLSAVADPPRADVEGLCGYFAAALVRNGVKATVTAKWRAEARLLLDKDDRPPAEVRAVIDWCTQDSFWRSNVLSVPKLREKYDQLRLAMERERPASSGNPLKAYLREQG